MPIMYVHIIYLLMKKHEKCDLPYVQFHTARIANLKWRHVCKGTRHRCEPVGTADELLNTIGWNRATSHAALGVGL
jgi:hypothetical protein